MAGAPCPVEVMKKVIDKMNMKEVTICYGLTETSPVITQTTKDDAFDKRVETVGKPHPENDVKVVNPETGKELPRNTPGELIIKGYNVMKGYYKNDEATKKSIRDGWLHTKDLSTMDEEGYVRILGRIDDMIIRGGENVYPKEIEEFLYTNPKIKMISVIGVPSKYYGEEVLACIQLKDGENATEDEIRNYCKEGISRYKVPKYVRFIDSFPMTASGKIQKFKLKESMVEKLKSEGVLE
jgi:fatty-acyl-CoA synthase